MWGNPSPKTPSFFLHFEIPPDVLHNRVRPFAYPSKQPPQAAGLFRMKSTPKSKAQTERVQGQLRKNVLCVGLPTPHDA